MKTDIEIAQEATLLPIKEVAANIGSKKMTLNYMANTRLNLILILWMK